MFDDPEFEAFPRLMANAVPPTSRDRTMAEALLTGDPHSADASRRSIISKLVQNHPDHGRDRGVITSVQMPDGTFEFYLFSARQYLFARQQFPYKHALVVAAYIYRHPSIGSLADAPLSPQQLDDLTTWWETR